MLQCFAKNERSLLQIITSNYLVIKSFDSLGYIAILDFSKKLLQAMKIFQASYFSNLTRENLFYC